MALFFRVIELGHGWECRHGQTTFDVHDSMNEALDHMLAVAASRAPSLVYLHAGDAAPVVVETFG